MSLPLSVASSAVEQQGDLSILLVEHFDAENIIVLFLDSEADLTNRPRRVNQLLFRLPAWSGTVEHRGLDALQEVQFNLVEGGVLIRDLLELDSLGERELSQVLSGWPLHVYFNLCVAQDWKFHQLGFVRRFLHPFE